MLVQDPTKGNSVDDIFDQARQSAVDVPPENPQNSSRSRSFTGTARLLSGETVPSAPQPIEVVTHTITFWRNGFSVDDGPLRGLDDPQNAPFLEVTCYEVCFSEVLIGHKFLSVFFKLNICLLNLLMSYYCHHLQLVIIVDVSDLFEVFFFPSRIIRCLSLIVPGYRA